jgi:hypothetical protein
VAWVAARDGSLETGDRGLRRNMTMVGVAQALQKARFEDVTVTIPEGQRVEQLAGLLAQENIMAGPKFLAIARQEETVQPEPAVRLARRLGSWYTCLAGCPENSTRSPSGSLANPSDQDGRARSKGMDRWPWFR